jgi:hypothetical protein
MSEPVIGEEIRKMQSEYEPLLPVEKKLIWYSFVTGVVLCVLLVLLSKLFR